MHNPACCHGKSSSTIPQQTLHFYRQTAVRSHVLRENRFFYLQFTNDEYSSSHLLWRIGRHSARHSGRHFIWGCSTAAHVCTSSQGLPLVGHTLCQFFQRISFLIALGSRTKGEQWIAQVHVRFSINCSAGPIIFAAVLFVRCLYLRASWGMGCLE